MSPQNRNQSPCFRATKQEVWSITPGPHLPKMLPQKSPVVGTVPQPPAQKPPAGGGPQRTPVLGRQDVRGARSRGRECQAAGGRWGAAYHGWRNGAGAAE